MKENLFVLTEYFLQMSFLKNYYHHFSVEKKNKAILCLTVIIFIFVCCDMGADILLDIK